LKSGAAARVGSQAVAAEELQPGVAAGGGSSGVAIKRLQSGVAAQELQSGVAAKGLQPKGYSQRVALKGSRGRNSLAVSDEDATYRVLTWILTRTQPIKI